MSLAKNKLFSAHNHEVRDRQLRIWRAKTEMRMHVWRNSRWHWKNRRTKNENLLKLILCTGYQSLEIAFDVRRTQRDILRNSELHLVQVSSLPAMWHCKLKSTQVNANQIKCWFLTRGENREPATNSTHLWRRVWESNPGHIGRKRVLSPLRSPCSFLMKDGAYLSFINQLLIKHHINVPGSRTYSWFSHDVTVAMLEPLNKETAAMLEPRPNPPGIQLYYYANVFFCFRWKTWMLITWVKTNNKPGGFLGSPRHNYCNIHPFFRLMTLSLLLIVLGTLLILCQINIHSIIKIQGFSRSYNTDKRERRHGAKLETKIEKLCFRVCSLASDRWIWTKLNRT